MKKRTRQKPKARRTSEPSATLIDHANALFDRLESLLRLHLIAKRNSFESEALNTLAEITLRRFFANTLFLIKQGSEPAIMVSSCNMPALIDALNARAMKNPGSVREYARQRLDWPTMRTQIDAERKAFALLADRIELGKDHFARQTKRRGRNYSKETPAVRFLDCFLRGGFTHDGKFFFGGLPRLPKLTASTVANHVALIMDTLDSAVSDFGTLQEFEDMPGFRLKKRHLQRKIVEASIRSAINAMAHPAK